MRDAEAAEMDEVPGAIALVRGCAFGIRVQLYFWVTFADVTQGEDVILVGMSEEKVFKFKLVLIDQRRDGRGIPAGIKERGLPSDFIPREVAIDRHALGGADLADFAPLLDGGGTGKPALGDPLQFCAVETDESRELGIIRRPIRLAGVLEPRQFSGGKASGLGGGFRNHVRRFAGFANDIAGMVLELHGYNNAAESSSSKRVQCAWRRRMLAGQAVLTGPLSMARTGSALRFSGEMQTSFRAAQSAGMVSV